MRILRLTNSGDMSESIPEHLRAFRLVEGVVARETGESAETVLRLAWPSSALPGLVDGWIEQYEPDVVFFRCAAFWCSYASVPLKIQRKFGRVGAPVARAGFKAGRSATLNANPAYRAMRRLAVRTIGGAYTFEPAQAAEIVESVMRRVIAHESVVPALRGAGAIRDSSGTAKGKAVAQHRNDALNRALAEMTARLHIAYEPGPPSYAHGEVSPDDVHLTEAGHRRQGELEGMLIARAWLASREGSGAPRVVPGPTTQYSGR